MHKTFLLVPLLGAILFLSCKTTAINGQTPEAKTQAPAFVTWDKKLIELGPVKKGDKRSMFYEFVNTSGSTVQIDIVDACDCTTVDFPRGAIEPNAKGRLEVVFNSAEKDAAETISINVIFKNTHPNGVPYIETVEYKFDLVK